MSKVPGYKERNFDEELGVSINYQGDGQTTKLNLKSIINTVKIIVSTNIISKNQMKNLKSFQKTGFKKYRSYRKLNLENIEYNKLKIKNNFAI
jgi:pyruvate,water dikinase